MISPFTTVVKGIKAAVKAVLNTEEYSGLKGKFKGWETANAERSINSKEKKLRRLSSCWDANLLQLVR